MPRDVDYCINHPDVAATDSCARCGRKLCYNCQMRMFGKAYCGFPHLLAAFPRLFLKGLVWLWERIRKGTAWLWIRAGRMPKHGWVELVLALGLVFSLVEMLHLRRAVLRLGTTSESQIKGVAVDTTGLALSAGFSPGKGGMVTSNKIDVSGQVEENRIVSLLVDGRLIRVMLPETGRFQFDAVPLHRGQNRLEVRAITPDGAVSILQTLLFTYGAPTLQYLLADFSRGPLDRKEVAFTFDGGSMDNAAEDILNSLGQRGVKCTFFLTGEFIQQHPGTVRRIVADGHDVGNHTWSHPHLTSFAQNGRQVTLPNVTAEKLRIELAKTAALFKKTTGKDMAPLWRAPFGEINAEIRRWAAEAGYRHVGWTAGRGSDENMDTMDWVSDRNSKAYRSADEIAAKILESSKMGSPGINGAVILMHLGTERRDDFPHKRLPDILDGLKNNGYRAVKVSDMLADRS
ncbi:MAG TPA: polysaccharide deacetylase family protein [bacterium]